MLDRESLVSAILAQMDEHDCTVLVNHEGVGVLSDVWHENRIRMGFCSLGTTAWDSMPRGVPLRMGQREMIDWIREKMDGTGLDVILPALRTVEFSRAEQSAGVVQRGKESLGRSVEAAVGNADTFPTGVDFTVSILRTASGFSLPITLRLHIEPLASEQKFKCWVNPDDVSDALWATESADGTEFGKLTVLLGEEF